MCNREKRMVAASDVCRTVVDLINHRVNFPSKIEERNNIVIRSLKRNHSDLLDDAIIDASLGEEAILVVVDQIFIEMEEYVCAWMVELVGAVATFKQIDTEIMRYEAVRYGVKI